MFLAQLIYIWYILIHISWTERMRSASVQDKYRKCFYWNCWEPALSAPPFIAISSCGDKWPQVWLQIAKRPQTYLSLHKVIDRYLSTKILRCFCLYFLHKNIHTYTHMYMELRLMSSKYCFKGKFFSGYATKYEAILWDPVLISHLVLKKCGVISHLQVIVKRLWCFWISRAYWILTPQPCRTYVFNLAYLNGITQGYNLPHYFL